MERLFKVRYWDYSDKKFNINGYICLGSSIAWGFLTIFMTEVIHKPIADFVTSLNPIVEFTFIAVVSVLFVYDTVRSTKEALDLARVLESMTKLKTEAEELQIQLLAHFDRANPRYATIIRLSMQGMSIDDICIEINLKPSRGRQEINNAHDAVCEYLRLRHHKKNRK